MSRRAAASVHPSAARDDIRAAAARAVRRAAAGELQLLAMEPPVTIEVEYRNGGEADYAAIVPGVERYGDRGIRISAPDAFSAYRALLAGIRLVGMVDLPLG
jgi:D-aminopeptidase